MSLHHCRVVFVRPQIPGNLGAAARVMRNLGFSDLFLVAPKASPDDPKARQMSARGEEVLERARICSELEEAISECLLHAWAWPQGRTIASAHCGFIRLRMSYVFNAGDNMPCLPKNYNPLAELRFLSQVSLAILAVPGVICYFNPNGEVLRDHTSFSEVWNTCAEQEKLPLPLWVNIRFFNLNENFGLMDTVGNGQLDIPDIEAIFPKSKYDPGDVDYYLRNVTHYLLDTERKIRSGEAFDGPGESNLSWAVECREDGLIQPPRRLLRLYPTVNRSEIEKAIAAVTTASA